MKKNNIILIIIIIILLAAVVYLWQKNQNNNLDSTTSAVEKVIKTIATPTSTEVQLQEFKDTNHLITINYPTNWQQKDLGGDKNVIEPLQRENVAFFYLPKSETDKSDVGSAIVSVKLLRFVLENNLSINSADDWYNYIKTKVDNFIADSVISANYQLISLQKTDQIDSKFVVEETYIEDELIQGKDFYILGNGEMYQFVTKSPKAYSEQFDPEIEAIAKSFKKS